MESTEKRQFLLGIVSGVCIAVIGFLMSSQSESHKAQQELLERDKAYLQIMIAETDATNKSVSAIARTVNDEIERLTNNQPALTILPTVRSGLTQSYSLISSTQRVRGDLQFVAATARLEGEIEALNDTIKARESFVNSHAQNFGNDEAGLKFFLAMLKKYDLVLSQEADIVARGASDGNSSAISFLNSLPK